MEKFFAYLLVIPYAIRASFLEAYHESRKQNKFIYKFDKPEFFKTKYKAVADANDKVMKKGGTWHVVEPAPGKFVAVAEKYFSNSGLKSVYQAN